MGHARPGSSANASCASCGQHDSSEFENQTYARKPTCAVCYQMDMVTTPFDDLDDLPRPATGVRAGGVTRRVAGGHDDRRTQRQAHRVRQRAMGTRSGGPAAGAPAHPRREGGVVTGFHCRRRSPVRRGASDRGGRQAARIVVAAARRRRGSRRGAGAAGGVEGVRAARAAAVTVVARDAAALGVPASRTTSGCERCARTTRCRRCCTPAIRCGTGTTTSGPTHPHLLDIDGPRDLTPQPGEALRDADFDVSPDGSFVVTSWHGPAPGASIRGMLVRIDVATAQRTIIADDPDADLELPAISPDGTAVAFIRETHSTPDRRRGSRCASCVSASRSSN